MWDTFCIHFLYISCINLVQYLHAKCIYIYNFCVGMFIQDYFEYILKKHKKSIDNPSVRMYVNKTENKITFKIKTGHYLELLIPETMKLFGSTENKITKDKNGENIPHIETTEVVLVHCSIVNNDYHQDLKVVSATFLLFCFLRLKQSTIFVKQAKMFFISLRKLFSFLR